MEKKSIDYKYSLSLVKQINNFVEKEPKLRNAFTYNGWNLWQSYQAILFSDAKVWSKEHRISQEPTSLVSKLKLGVVSVGIITISLSSMVYLFFSKKNILVFTEDKVEGRDKNDSRLEALYEAMNLEKVRYMEVVHTIASKQTFKKFLNRGREVVYLEAVDFIVAPVVFFRKLFLRKFIESLDVNSFPSEDRKFVTSELEKLLSLRLMSIARIKFFSWLLRLSDVQRLFSIDDTRHYNEFILAGRDRGIPTIALQHGHYTRYQTGWLKMTTLPGDVIRPRALLVWSNYWKEELLRLGTYFLPNEIVVGGQRLTIIDEPRQSKGKLSVLIPYEADAPKQEVRVYIEKLLKCKDVEVIFKLRADQDKQQALEEYDLLGRMDDLTVVRSMDEVISRASICVGTYSTLLYDMVERLRPVAILESSLDYEQGMVDNGLAEFIRADEDVCKRVKTLSKIPQVLLESRREKLVGGERRRLVSVLRDIIKENVSN